jgi:hypothetical protein
MKFEIKNRLSGNVQLTAEIDCTDDTVASVRLRLAVKSAIGAGANLSGADLSGANLSRAYLSGANLSRADLTRADFSSADLSSANLYGAYLTDAKLTDAKLTRAYFTAADLTRADLTGADLSRADLSGANLSRADLTGADLTGANLSRAYLGTQWVIQGPIRSDGYQFLLMKLTGDTEPMIRAGCRYFTVSAAIEYWNKKRGGTPLGQESLAIVHHLMELHRIRNEK